MNWAAMGVMAAVLALCAVVAGVVIWLIGRGMHPAWIVLGTFLLMILHAGLAP